LATATESFVLPEAAFCATLLSTLPGGKLAAGALALVKELVKLAEFFVGRIILGKADAADSVPGPGPEKKTENGVWLAAGKLFPAKGPLGAISRGMAAGV
jgi:hypothetical protein